MLKLILRAGSIQKRKKLANYNSKMTNNKLKEYDIDSKQIHIIFVTRL